jgi:Flp pilus assembly pilin Flp
METSAAHQRRDRAGAQHMLTSTYITTIWLRDRIRDMVRDRTSSDRGAALVEYAFLLSFIVVVCVAAVTLLGSTNNASATRSANSIVAAN